MSNRFISNKINKMEEYNPCSAKYQVRLDANESPFGLSDEILSEFEEAVKSISYNRYPDPRASELVEKFAAVYNVKSENVVAGNGSDELISLICTGFLEPGDKLITLTPDFSMYQFYAELVGAEVINFYKTHDFQFDFGRLIDAVMKKKAKAVIFSNPCNPTSAICSREDIITLVKACSESSCLVIADEAYMEFCDTDESVMSLVDQYDNLIVLKTLSKAFGLAGLRVGFMISNPDIVLAVRKFKSPYNLNALSQKLAGIVLDHYDEIKNNIQMLKTGTQALYEAIKGLEEVGNFTILKPYANFITLAFDDKEAAAFVSEKLHEYGIAVRFTSGLLRINCGKEEENKKFIDSFTEIVGGKL